ncbi:hypothetical protein GCM10028818_00840 [Spirosoma horti]
MQQIPETKKKAIEEYYDRLQEKCLAVGRESFHSAEIEAFAENHHFISDFEKWLEVLNKRPEKTMLEASLREYQFSLLAVIQGQYRHAYSSLRLFLELALGAVYLSANELELRVWLRSQRDLQWSPIIGENGIFTKRFVDAFFEELTEEAPHYCTIARTVYRECSEFVHGNAHTHDVIPEQIKFDTILFKQWLENARSIRMVICFSFCVRYLTSLDSESKSKLELAVLGELNHLRPIRTFFES